VNVLRDAGYTVNRVVCIVDRMDDHKIWEDNNIEFISLFTLSDVARPDLGPDTTAYDKIPVRY